MQVTPIALAYNTTYLVETPAARVLIDTGPDYEGAWDALQEGLGGAWPGLVVATHGHYDHAGLGARWQREGVPVWLGAGDETMTAGPVMTESVVAAMLGYARSIGTPIGVLGEVEEGLRTRKRWERAARLEGYPEGGRGSRWPTGLRYEPFVPDRLIEADTDIPGTGLRVLRAPGHTRGNLVVVAEAEGMLFSGDQLLAEITPTPAIQFDSLDGRVPSLPPFVDSLRRIRSLSLERCYPGHGEPFDGVAGTIDANLTQIEARARRVRALREAEGATVYAVAELLYPRALRRRYWQIVATVQGALDLAEGG